MQTGNIMSALARITTHLKNALEEQQEPDVVHTNSGRLDARAVYRIRAMHDLNVFCKEIVYPLPDFTVDLVLDASSSRYREQEGIAAQAYMIARSLMNLQIPVQVVSFRSVRGYTVLQRLKGYEAAESAEGIFHYYTAGNNRDGLAFQAVRALMEQSGYERQKRIVLVLTDAMPSDVYKAFVPGRLRSSRDYDEALAVEDTWRSSTFSASKRNACGGNFLGRQLCSGQSAENIRRFFCAYPDDQPADRCCDQSASANFGGIERNGVMAWR